MRNWELIAHLRTRISCIYLDAFPVSLGFNIMETNKKTRGEQAGLENRLFLSCGGDGGKTWSWNRIRSPREEEKNTVCIL